MAEFDTNGLTSGEEERLVNMMKGLRRVEAPPGFLDALHARIRAEEEGVSQEQPPAELPLRRLPTSRRLGWSALSIAASVLIVGFAAKYITRGEQHVAATHDEPALSFSPGPNATAPDADRQTIVPAPEASATAPAKPHHAVGTTARMENEKASRTAGPASDVAETRQTRPAPPQELLDAARARANSDMIFNRRVYTVGVNNAPPGLENQTISGLGYVPMSPAAAAAPAGTTAAGTRDSAHIRDSLRALRKARHLRHK